MYMCMYVCVQETIGSSARGHGARNAELLLAEAVTRPGNSSCGTWQPLMNDQRPATAINLPRERDWPPPPPSLPPPAPAPPPAATPSAPNNTTTTITAAAAHHYHTRASSYCRHRCVCVRVFDSNACNNIMMIAKMRTLLLYFQAV